MNFRFAQMVGKPGAFWLDKSLLELKMSTEPTPQKHPSRKPRSGPKNLQNRPSKPGAKAQRLEAKARAVQAGAERAKDTKRKVLLGACVMAVAKAQGWDLSALCLGQQPLADYLVRDDDRALFSLPPIPVLTAQVQAPEAQALKCRPQVSQLADLAVEFTA